MGTKFLIDTNVVVEFLSGSFPNSGSLWIQNIIDQNLHQLSVINQIELLSYNGPPAEMQILEEFIHSAIVLPLSDDVVQKTIELRKSRKIKLPDAIIAATAIVYQFDLISRNTADFKSITGLNTIDPYSK